MKNTLDTRPTTRTTRKAELVRHNDEPTTPTTITLDIMTITLKHGRTDLTSSLHVGLPVQGMQRENAINNTACVYRKLMSVCPSIV